MKIMAGMMEKLRENPPAEIAGQKVTCVSDYERSVSICGGKTAPIDLPKSNVLEYALADGCTAIVRPSGTEPKIKLYLSVVGRDMAEIDARAAAMGADVKRIMGV